MTASQIESMNRAEVPSNYHYQSRPITSATSALVTTDAKYQPQPRHSDTSGWCGPAVGDIKDTPQGDAD